MNAKPTPGPWKVARRYASSSFLVQTANDTPICQIDHWSKRENDLSAGLKPDGEPEANAALIARAPELLAENTALRRERDALREACKSLIEVHDKSSLYGISGWEEQERDALKAIRQALQIAT